MSVESVMPSNHLIFRHPLLLLPSVFPIIRVFSSESALHFSKSQSIGVLAVASTGSFQWTPRTDLLQNGLTGSPCSPRDSQESYPAPQFKSINSLALSFLYGPVLISVHDSRKNHSFDYTDLCWQSDTMSSFVKAFFPRSKYLLISWLQSPSEVILEPKKLKSVTASTFFPFICHEVMGPDTMIFIFWTLSFKPVFHSPLLPLSRDSLVPLRFLP